MNGVTSGQPNRDPSTGHFLYSPAASYPQPYARLVDRDGRTVHTWSNSQDQPSVEDDPPTYLRGWNHVEVNAEGHLFAMVPLRSLLKLDADSSLVWKADITAHHDLAFSDDGEVHVLTERPRLVEVDGTDHVILDNAITVLSPSGVPRRETSLYDLLCRDPATAGLVRREVLRRKAAFTPGGRPSTGGGSSDPAVVAETADLLATGVYGGSPTRASELLRGLPGSPCDVLHTNTVEILGPHPHGLWKQGDVLVSVRNLDLIAVLDLTGNRVVWHWGNGVLSGQHQPSALPDGTVLVFDNGAAVGRSRLLVVDPVDGEIRWEYVADPPASFFTALAGGCERLPGGNILVTEAQSGRTFELTPDRRIVWEWTTPKPPSDRAGRVTLYRMSAVPDHVAARIVGAEERGTR